MEPKTEFQKNAISNAIKKERETYQRAIDMQWFNNRIEDSKMSRCLALINKETEMERNFKEKTDHAAIVDSQADKEVSLAYEISKQARDEACQLLRRHHLRETDPQLRELTRKLRNAYVQKDLEQQILQNEYRRLQDKIETANANKIVQDAIYDSTKTEEKDKRELEKRHQYCAELKIQIDNDKKLKQNTQKTETAIQRKQINDIVKSIEEERKRNIQLKQKSVDGIRQEMLQFGEARRVLRRREAEANARELQRVAREQAAVTDRTSAVIQERLQRQRAREELNQRVGEQIAAAEAERSERSELIRQLQHHEYLERGIQEELADKVKRVTVGAQVREALDAQAQARAEAARARERDDREHRAYFEAKIAAEEEKERENMRLKRERARRHALELRTQMEERRRRKARDMEERRAVVTEHQEKWDAEARTEAELILKEHGRVLTKE
ncbi:meiosis-specific nuclear structural protein 1-like [Aricia agestis]|uniref:meiosis-specific nuclear structural protein 1-like n=1 Tax=Aricia agestis TaxID=91739 RepID=UPI001C2082D7|nr:meiosis-specific nuclear structural protein 1-like [Aricia agestis]